jgi:hypothetical protein
MSDLTPAETLRKAASPEGGGKQFGSQWAHENGGRSKGGDMDAWPEDLRIRDFPREAETDHAGHERDDTGEFPVGWTCLDCSGPEDQPPRVRWTTRETEPAAVTA